MSGHGVQGRADRFEQVDAGGERTSLVDKPGQPPFRCLLGLGPADPAKHLFDAPGLGRLQIHGDQFVQGGNLRFGEGTFGILQRGPAACLGHAGFLGLGKANVLDGVGEQLHHMKPNSPGKAGGLPKGNLATGHGTTV